MLEDCHATAAHFLNMDKLLSAVQIVQTWPGDHPVQARPANCPDTEEARLEIFAKEWYLYAPRERAGEPQLSRCRRQIETGVDAFPTLAVPLLGISPTSCPPLSVCWHSLDPVDTSEAIPPED